MRDDSCLHFRHGISNPDQENVLHLNCSSHLNYRLAKTQHFNLNFPIRLHVIIWTFLVIRNIDKYVVLPFTN